VITGYNTDVKHDGRVYHVQTEDKGVKNPILETLVYISGGQIIASKQYDYSLLVKDDQVDEKELAELLESQHRRIMRWIAGGKFDEKGPPPFGSSILSDRSFDEVVLEFIGSQAGAEPIEMVMEGELHPVAGADLPLKVLIRNAGSGSPAGGAKLTVLLRQKGSKPAKVLSVSAGADGVADGMVKIPESAAAGFLLLEARMGGQVNTMEARIAKP
jgi:hypothetical protein